MATHTSVSDQRSILARWRARDSCADRSPISGHRKTYSEAKCAVANGDFKGDAQPAIFTSTGGSLRALGAFMSWTPTWKPRSSFFLSIVVFFATPRAQTWNLIDAQI